MFQKKIQKIIQFVRRRKVAGVTTIRAPNNVENLLQPQMSVVSSCRNLMQFHTQQLASFVRFPMLHCSLQCKLPATWLTTAASSSTLARLILARFSAVGRAPTSATKPSVQLDLKFGGTICQQTSRQPDLSYIYYRESLKMFLCGQWHQSAV